MKKLTVLILAALLLAGCAAQSIPPVQYAGQDACEYAKLVLIRANEICQNDCSSFFSAVRQSANNQVMSASRAVKAACEEGDSEKEKGTWACAEGHSCR